MTVRPGLDERRCRTHAVHSKRYLLKAENESDVRHAFGTGVLSFYESDQKLSTEAAGRQLIHYRAAKRVPPNEIAEFIKRGVRVLTLFRK